MAESIPDSVAPSADDGTQDYVSQMTFDEFGMSEELRRAVAERGYLTPTPVQAAVWAKARAGHDLIVRSKTGTGKTAAFGMPIIEQIPIGTKDVTALVLCPTRELAIQVRDELAALAVHRDLAVTAIYGGDSMHRQTEALKTATAIVVGTPGRVQDHISRGTLKLGGIRHAVLDEADEMLAQGFYEDVTHILSALPKKRQILLFSATVPTDIQRMIAQYTSSAETLLLSGDVFTVDHIHHVRYEISQAYPKPRNLLYILELEDPENAIIFCNTRDDTELVTAVLNRNGLDAEMLNGDLAQSERERVMGRVKRGELAFMVATDLAARGIDISDLAYVINYSLPEDPAVYLHRVGRTGRIGKKGTAISLTSGRELATLTALETKYGIKFEVRASPTAEQAEKMWTERHVKLLKEASVSSVYEGFLSLAAQLKTRPDADELIAILLRSFFTYRRIERAQAPQVAAPPKRPSEPKREKRPRPARPAPRKETHDAAPRHRARRETPAGSTRLWLNLGRGDAVNNATLVTALEALGAPTGKVARAEVRDGYSYLDVGSSDVDAFMSLNGKQHQAKVLKIEPARK